VNLYRRRLPHVYSTDRAVFLTWRLYGTLPAVQPTPQRTLTTGKAFVAFDRLLDQTTAGARHLRTPEIARTVLDAIEFNSASLHHFTLHAFAVMPNHVHLLLTPAIPLPDLTRSLKGITAKRANEILQRKGERFWQEESFDRVVRNGHDFEKIQRYIEWNPVQAQLVSQPGEYRWSSAWSSAEATQVEPLQVERGPPGPREAESRRADGAACLSTPPFSCRPSSCRWSST
jgi:REP element-mobilizing transposase RayT